MKQQYRTMYLYRDGRSPSYLCVGPELFIWVESELEKDAALWLLYQPDFEYLESQPEALFTIRESEHGHRKLSQYTLDFMFKREGQPMTLIEVKPDKFVNSDLTKKLADYRPVAEASGYRLELMRESDARVGHRSSNMPLLHLHSRLAVNEPVWNELHGSLPSHITLAELRTACSEVGISVSHAYWAIWTHQVRCDLDGEKLSPETILEVLK